MPLTKGAKFFCTLAAALTSKSMQPYSPPCSCGAPETYVACSNPSKSQKRSGYSWIVDSGATVHCINDISFFESIDSSHPPVTITVANGRKIQAVHVGTVRLKMQDHKGCTKEYLLQNVVYSPHFSHCLLSVRRLWKDHRLKTRFGATNCFKDANNSSKFAFPESCVMPMAMTGFTHLVRLF